MLKKAALRKMAWEEAPKGLRARILQKHLLKLNFLEKYNMHPDDFNKLSLKFLKIRSEYKANKAEKTEFDNACRNKS